MKLSDALDPARIALDLSATDKVGALEELLALAGASLQLPDTQPLLSRILERENICSTAVNRGVAIPHARSPLVQGVVASLGIHRAGLEYDSPDGEPVQLVFLVLSSEIATPAYLSVLGRTARIFRRDEMRQKVLDADSAAQIIEYVAAQEPA